MPAIPPQLLAAVAAHGGGQITVVLGAGCSCESPTSVPLSAVVSAEACRALELDGILPKGSCADPSDLAAVADKVFEIYGKQAELVKRLPIDTFRMAPPNEGYRLLAALLAEHAIGAAITLNYDMALPTAVSTLHLSQDVTVVANPQETPPIGKPCIVFLHNHAYETDLEKWVLRKISLDQGWQNGWQEVVTNLFLAAPNVIFAGLGSPAPVLEAAVKKIGSALGGKNFFQNDIVACSDSTFAKELGIPTDRFVQAGWSAFMASLANRLLSEQMSQLRMRAAALYRENALSHENVDPIFTELEARGLLELGLLRARCRLEGSAYSPGIRDV